jgi:Bacterial regulatory helix-turn-helix protein, lysR family
MREVNLAGLDLNLLPPLEALLRNRNVTRAAAEVGLSQPAMSRALARLRSIFGDPVAEKSSPLKSNGAARPELRRTPRSRNHCRPAAARRRSRCNNIFCCCNNIGGN